MDKLTREILKGQEIELEVVKAYELDPSKDYLIELDSSSYSMEDANQLYRRLVEKGFSGVLSVRKGDGITVVNEIPVKGSEQNE